MLCPGRWVSPKKRETLLIFHQGPKQKMERISVSFRSQRRGPDVSVGEGCVELYLLSLSLSDCAIHPPSPLALVSRVMWKPPGEAAPPGRGPYGPEYGGKCEVNQGGCGTLAGSQRGTPVFLLRSGLPRTGGDPWTQKAGDPGIACRMNPHRAPPSNEARALALIN